MANVKNVRPLKISASAETRIKIMETAERLFGDFGFDAVALRTISAEADQRNTNSVQYHFGDKLRLLQQIFEYREGQLDVMRGEMLASDKEHGKLSDVRELLRVCFQPNFRHFIERDGLPYIKLHAQYLAHLRPRGVVHPIDYDCPSTLHFRDAIARLQRKLSFLTVDQFNLRLEAVGAMFLGAVIQHAGRPADSNASHPTLFDTILEMMAAAMTVPPWDFIANKD